MMMHASIRRLRALLLPRLPIAVLLVLGLAGGALSDESRTAPPERRGGYVVLAAELHAHTRFSDGVLSPFELVLAARRAGVHALAVTEHNTLWPSRLARWFSERIGGPIVLVGEEVTTRAYHVLALGLREAVAPAANVADVVAEVHRQGGVAIAAHPAAGFWPALDPVATAFDGIEVVHPAAFRNGARGFRWADMVAFYERAREARPRITAVGTSDYHLFKTLGLCRTLVFAREPTAEGILDALREGRTVVHAPDGRTFGDRALAELVAREPLADVEHEVGYRPRGALDAVSRLFGWLGLLGLVLVRRRPS
jgi:hypothetical protein